MRCGKMITMAAATFLALGLSARADDAEDPRLKQEADTAEQRRDAAAADREGRGDREAGPRVERRDAETVEAEQRRAERSDSDRGRARDEAAMPRMRAGGGMPRMQAPGGMPGRGARNMMSPQGMPPLERLRETDPEMFELEQNDQRLDRESHELAEQYRRVPEGPARDELRDKLQETVKRHFKARQERRELEVKRLQAQLERLRATVERRAKDADTIIDHRISQLLGEEDFGF